MLLKIPSFTTAVAMSAYGFVSAFVVPLIIRTFLVSNLQNTSMMMMKHSVEFLDKFLCIVQDQNFCERDVFFRSKDAQ